MGHYAVNWPSSTTSTRNGTQSLQVGLTITETTKEAPKNNIINPNWILPDTFSTISSIRKKEYCPKHPTLWCRRGAQEIHKLWTPRLWPRRNSKIVTFWGFFNDKSLANMLYFTAVASNFAITIDTELYSFINVHLQEGARIIFNQCGAGLYYFDTTN